MKWIKVQHLGYDQEFKPNKFDDHFTTNSHQKSGKTFIKNKNPRNVILHSIITWLLIKKNVSLKAN